MACPGFRDRGHGVQLDRLVQHQRNRPGAGGRAGVLQGRHRLADHWGSVVAGSVGWGPAFAILAIGPALGTAAMLRLRKMPEAAVLALGRR